MNRIRNEKGYAIIVVLFLVMFTLFVGAAFMTASISNAKQEKMVDSNNIAYVAAEMGLEYSISNLQIGESTVAHQVYFSIIPLIQKHNRCGGIENSNDCVDVKSIDEIKAIARTMYIRELDNFLTSQLNKVNDKIHPEDDSITYTLDSYSTNVIEDKVVIELNVQGSSISDPGRVLTAWVNYQIPIFIQGESSGTPIDQVTNPEHVFQYFIPPDANEGAPCFGGPGHCGNSGTYVSSGYVVSDTNANNLEGFTWLHIGEFDAKNNMNNLSITLIIESLKYKNNMNNMSGKIVFIGKENKEGILDIGEISLDNGTVCINLDGYPDNQLSNVNIINNGKRMYYSSKEVLNLPNSLRNFTRYNGSLIKFVQECTGLNYHLPEGSVTPGYEIILNPIDYDIDIDY